MPKIEHITTALQLNSELFLALSKMGDDKKLLQKVVDFVKGLASAKVDDTLMTKEEYFSMLEKAEKDLDEGKGVVMLPGENLADLIKRVG